MSASPVFALWFGGASYSGPSVPQDVERFDSVESARTAFVDRCQIGSVVPCDFPYVNREPERVLTPAVDDDSTEMWIFLADPSESDDPYPDKIVSYGPRGGLRTRAA